MKYKRVCCVASKKAKAQSISDCFIKNYYHEGLIINELDFSKNEDFSDLDSDIDIIVIFGGDGFMLDTIHKYIDSTLFKEKNVPIYGINCGSIGFLLNYFSRKNMLSKIEDSIPVKLFPLKAKITTTDGNVHTRYAFNEISVLRSNHQATHIKISLDGVTRLQQLVCDGILVSTPVGSTAYNLAGGGFILPSSSNLLSIVPISPFRPRKWKGTIIRDSSIVSLEALNTLKRPISVANDSHGIENVKFIEIEKDTSLSINLLFNANYTLDDKILKEQFAF